VLTDYAEGLTPEGWCTRMARSVVMLKSDEPEIERAALGGSPLTNLIRDIAFLPAVSHGLILQSTVNAVHV
jgi:hypothetical protein